MANVDQAKEEIGWLKLLLVLVFTVTISWTGWMVQNLSWPAVPEDPDLWKTLSLFAEKLGLWELLALAVEMFLLSVMLILGIEIRLKINKLGEIHERRDR